MKKLLYQKIAESIMQDIIEGKLKPGDKVLSVREMAVNMKVNPKTIQRSFELLDEQNIFTSIKGEGRFVSADPEQISKVKNHLLAEEIDLFVSSIEKYQLTNQEIITLIEKRLIEGKENE